MGATFDQVVEFIVDKATEEEAEAIFQCYKKRTRILRKMRVAKAAIEVKPGTKVKLLGLRPSCLVGMTGEVAPYEGRRRIPCCDVVLDEESTRKLRIGQSRIYVSPDEKNHRLLGVPLDCIEAVR